MVKISGRVVGIEKTLWLILEDMGQSPCLLSVLVYS